MRSRVGAYVRRLAPILGRIRRLGRRDVGLAIAILALLPIVGLVFLLNTWDADDAPPVAADVVQEPATPGPEPSDTAGEPSEEPEAPGADLPDTPADSEQAQPVLTRDASPDDDAPPADPAPSAADPAPAALAPSDDAAPSSADPPPSAADPPPAAVAPSDDADPPAAVAPPDDDAPSDDDADAAPPGPQPAEDDEAVSAVPEQEVAAPTDAAPATTDDETPPVIAAADASPAADIVPRPRFAAPPPVAASPPRFAEPPAGPVASPRPAAAPLPETAQAPPELPVTQPLGILAPAIAERLAALPNGIGITTIDLRRDLVFTHQADTYYDLASVAKVPLMLAVLQEGERAERTLSRRERVLLETMIHTSSNEAASALWQGAGTAVPDLLTQLDVWPAILVPGGWGLWTGNAYGVAQVFREIVAGAALSEGVRHDAMGLLAGVASWQRWGISAGLPEGGASVGLKNGWYPAKDGWLVHSAGYVLDAGGQPDYVIVILSAQNKTLAVGIELVEEIAASIHAALRAGVVSAGVPRSDR